jgi:hypothetical protein
MNTKYQIGQRVTWRDANKHMVGTIIKIHERTNYLPALYFMVVKDTNREFGRYEYELTPLQK